MAAGVYRCLEELFPQIDPRILKAVAYEHRKDVDAAVEVILSEILPSMIESTTVPCESTGSKSYSDDEAHHEEERLSLRHRRAGERMQGSHNGSNSALPYNNDTIGHVGSSTFPASPFVGHYEEERFSLRHRRVGDRMQGSNSALPYNNDTVGHVGSSNFSASPFIDLEAFWDENVASHDTSTFGDPFALKEAEDTVVHLERTSEDQTKTPVPLNGAAVFDEVNANTADCEELILLGSTGKTGGNTERLLIDLNEQDYGESGSIIINNGPLAYDHHILISENGLQQKSDTSPEIVNLVYQQPPSVQEDPVQTLNKETNKKFLEASAVEVPSQESLYEEANPKLLEDLDFVGTPIAENTQHEAPSRETLSEEAYHNLVEAQTFCGSPIAENTQQEAPSREDVTYHYDVNSDVAQFIRRSPETEGAAYTNLTRSSQIGEVHLLEQIVEDAKNNKMALLSAFESVMDTMKEVEAQEMAAEKAKEEAAVAGLDIYSKVEELHQTLARAKEANDMHAGEVYGERAILATEVRELQSRLLCLSDERDSSLTILDEMRAGLETRLAAAEKLRQESEHEKHAKEGFARRALVEQEALMEKVVQESKRLQEEAQENNKLREFLMDRGHIVDTLQGEIAVICQDVKLLKEKFDSGVSLSKSISSSQTTCILASSSSSMESCPSERGQFIAKTPEKLSPSPSVNSSPKRAVYATGMGHKVEDEGWELCGDDDFED